MFRKIINSLKEQGVCDVEEIPEFHVNFESEKKSKYLILIPVINEGERILKQLQGMKDINLDLDLLLVDGGSSDGSTEFNKLKTLGVDFLITKIGSGKLSSQLRIGFAWALYRGYDGVITIDGNGKDDFKAIPQFAKKLDEGFKQIQGSRYLKDGIAENTPLDRELAVKLIHAPVISIAARFRYTDSTNGFRAYSCEFLRDQKVRPFRNIFSTYNLHYYLAIRAPRLGYKVCEIPVARRYPANVPTPSKIGGISGKLHILKQTFFAAFGIYNPK